MKPLTKTSRYILALLHKHAGRDGLTKDNLVELSDGNTEYQVQKALDELKAANQLTWRKVDGGWRVWARKDKAELDKAATAEYRERFSIGGRQYRVEPSEVRRLAESGWGRRKIAEYLDIPLADVTEILDGVSDGYWRK